MSKIFATILAIAVFFAAGSFITTAVSADVPAAADGTKLKAALTPLAKLLVLMDTDKIGKVSKEEYMKFMEAEFDFADKNKDGQLLDPVETNNLVFRLNHPFTGMPRVGNSAPVRF
jgi:hypothetical protein